MKPTLGVSVRNLGLVAVIFVGGGLSPAVAQSDHDAQSENEFVATKSSKVYHSRWCTYAKRIGETNRIRFASRQEAEASGRRLCKFCQRLEKKESESRPPPRPVKPSNEERNDRESRPAPGETEAATSPVPVFVRVEKVLEGGTLELDTGDKLRLLGVLCPEEGQSLAKEVCRFIREQTRGRQVRLAYDTSTGMPVRRDALGRIVARVFLQTGDRDLGKELLHQGFGWLDHDGVFDGRPAYEEEERDAAWDNRGVWRELEGPAGQRKVVIGKNAAHYHDPNCRHVPHLTDPKTVTVNQAKTLHRSPCRLFRFEPIAKKKR